MKFPDDFTYYFDANSRLSDEEIDTMVQNIIKDPRENCWQFVKAKEIMVGKIGRVIFVASNVYMFGAR